MIVPLFIAGLFAVAMVGVFVWQALRPRSAIRLGHMWAFEEDPEPRPWYVAWTELRATWGVIAWSIVAIVCFVSAFAIPAQQREREEERAAKAAERKAWSAEADRLRGHCRELEPLIEAHPALADGKLDDDLAALNVDLAPHGAEVREEQRPPGIRALDLGPRYALHSLATPDDAYLQAHGLDSVEIGWLSLVADQEPARASVFCQPRLPVRLP